jgi:glycine/D-amino acid oxidase-like deaminating enzyme
MKVVVVFSVAFLGIVNAFHVSHSTSQAVSRLQMVSNCYDLAVIGGGVVGVQAALAAASAPFSKKVCLIDAPREGGMLMNEADGEDLSIGAPTGLFGKALRDTSKRISVSTLRGMGLREER